MRTLKSVPATFLLRIVLWLVCACTLGGFLSGCSKTTPPKETTSPTKLPFAIFVVPGRTGITMAKKNPDEFYVVLTNISGEPQPVWETWNSWGYQTISFELATSDGKKYIVSKAHEGFTRNFPSTFLVKPGEHQIYTIRLDEQWETHPALTKTDELPITLKAVFEVTPSPEAKEFKVWTGRVESHNYDFSLRQW